MEMRERGEWSGVLKVHSAFLGVLCVHIEFQSGYTTNIKLGYTKRFVFVVFSA